ncbi:M6 family metalloprotease domain-containing protein [Streptomyces sp. NBC_00006]|uniref:M6 family metalloprotease domain-containing protein n=1 Tax=unclassified Streptomyces TaxID=2593676 RepID=UPI0022532997|nr:MULTISPECIES: M6 family metalloprotease domain-containing protein [unclassified Streptomyces]MCX4827608.1 M6 family metalloprotease domain-containing protein [Streptomyces sp. NBC_01016]MCX5532982.1 M6 family metalloprotease domain-containing protein [Streptomyces sp. NBC_00006]
MRAVRRIRRGRRGALLAASTAVALAVTMTASTGRLLDDSTTAAGPVAVSRTTSLAPCMIRGSFGVQMSEGLPTAAGYARSTGTVRALNLMVDFPDAPGQGSAKERLGEFFPQTQDWFAAGSYGKLDYVPEAPVDHWLRMPKPFTAYGIDRGAPFDPGYRKLADDIAAAADPEVDFRRYDLVNILVTPNAGPSALDTVLSVTFAGNHEAPVADGVPLSNASFVYSRQDDGSGSYAKTGYRVLPHENGHVFGLPDLYTQDGGGAAGHWDIMSEDWGAGNDLLGWHKWKLGWLDDSQVGCAAQSGTTEYRLSPLARNDGRSKLVFVPLTRKTGYAIEVRTQGGNDEAVCRAGVLVYKVDADVDTGQGPVKVEDATPDSGGCTRQPNVHAELSDAAYQAGEVFRDKSAGVRVTVGGITSDGDYQVYVTRS